MRRLIAFSIFIILTFHAWGQDSQSVTLAKGGSVTLKANADNALSFLWSRNGEPILNHYEDILVVKEAGLYTVTALGHYCDSDPSDPVEVIISDEGPVTKTVDMNIRNLPDKNVVIVGQPITYQIIALNKSDVLATGVKVVITLPEEVIFDEIVGIYEGQVVYNLSNHEIIWTVDSMIAGQSLAINFSVKTQEKGFARSVSVVSSLEKEQNPVDNQAVSQVEIIALRIPNVFTPNGDGFNDLFEIKGLEHFPANRLNVFNSDGLEVYRSEHYRNDWNGRGLNEGVYFYLLEIQFHNGKWQLFKGHVSILKDSFP